MVKVTKAETLKLAKKYKINLDVISLDTFQYGINTELEEHNKKGKFNVVKGSKDTAAKIAIGHLLEYSDYYNRLEKMELSAEKYWSRRHKPSIFLK
jgi:hypothetical protein